MGCAQTRGKTEEQEIESAERNLRFFEYTIPQIKQAFFIPSGPEAINKNQLNKAIEQLGVQYNEQQKESFKMFISAFQKDQNETTTFYILKDLLIAIFLLSKSTQQEKASALFDMFDEHASKKITKEDLQNMLLSLIEVVFNYSEKFLDNEEGVVQAHHEIVDLKEEEIMPKLFTSEFSNSEFMNKAEFLKWIETTTEKFFDFMNPKSIRETLMDFVLHAKKTQIELQQMYQVGKNKKETTNESEQENTQDDKSIPQTSDEKS